MSQPFLICQILQFLSLDEDKTKGCDTPVGKPLLDWDLVGIPRKHPWLYQGAVGMISYLANSVRPKIQMAMHQTARFLVNPMHSHELAIMQIGQYICDNAEHGIIYKVDKSKGPKVNAGRLCWRMECSRFGKCRQCSLKNWFRNLLYQLSHSMVQQTANQDCTFHC
jgi:hypothetical protein